MTHGKDDQIGLRRTIRLPLLVFYGLGVTVGAGIFALIGGIVGTAGDQAPLAFLVAGALAAMTARSYALMARRHPRAAGAALYATAGFGPWAGRLAGIGVLAGGIIGSATITLAFAGHLGSVLPLPQLLLVALVLAGVGSLAWLGIRESLSFAAVITVVEVGTLVVIAALGVPLLLSPEPWQQALTLPAPGPPLEATIAAVAVAFFAFIGFEDIVNMAEETVAPERTMGRAIALTLIITTALYVLLAMVAIAAPDRAALTASSAPLADLFSQLTGWPPTAVSLIATIAMTNGVLALVLMSSRVLYGMAREGLAPAWVGVVDRNRQTPVRATLLVVAAIAILVAVAPMLALAQVTSYVTLTVFTLVNLSLWRSARRSDDARFRRHASWGLAAAAATAAVLVFEAVRRVW